MSQSEVLFRLTVGEEDYMSRWARRNGIDKFDQGWNGSNTKTHPFLGNGPKSMKRTFALILAALAAAALSGGVVHAVLVAAHVSEPAATTVYGLTPRRLWATTVAVLALVGVVIGGLALARSRRIALGRMT